MLAAFQGFFLVCPGSVEGSDVEAWLRRVLAFRWSRADSCFTFLALFGFWLLAAGRPICDLAG